MIPKDLVSDSTIEALRSQSVYFGHQSVGYNIMDGMKMWLDERPGGGLKILETKTSAEIVEGTLAHSKNGENHHPLKKIADFAATLEGGVGDQVDIAFFKFCYVDITEETDFEDVFDDYKSTMERLHKSYPDTRFVHVTVPLVVVQGGAKARLKKLLGRELWGVGANIARHRFNELLRKEYAGRDPFFDLAAVEATRVDGSPVRFREGGAEYPSLAAEYASDGKHLNELGARWVAGHLLKTLGELSRGDGGGGS